jgi:hypothetical protein
MSKKKLQSDGAFITRNDIGLLNIIGKKVGNKSTKFPIRRELTQCLLTDISKHFDGQREVNFSLVKLSTVKLNEHELIQGNIKPPRWKEASSGIKAICYQKALAETNHLVPFTFNLSIKLNAQAVASGNVTDYLRRRLVDHMKRKLGRHIQFWFAVEVAHKVTKGRPHIHGSLSIKENEEKNIKRNVFHALNGEVDFGFKKFAIKFSKRGNYNKGDAGWATYSTKRIKTSKLLYLNENLLTVDNITRRRAKEIYSDFRNIVLEAQNNVR